MTKSLNPVLVVEISILQSMKTYYRVLLFSSVLFTMSRLSFAQITATWEDAIGVTISSNGITKTAVSGWNAGAASVEMLDYLTNGWVELTVGTTDSHRGFGLSDANPDPNLNTIDHGFYLQPNGIMTVRESTQNKFTYSTLQAGDILRVERVDGKIYYKVNGTIIYTSTITSIIPLMVDFTISSENATFNQFSLSNSFTDLDAITPPVSQQTVSWTDVIGVIFEGDKIIKTGADGWSTGAASIEMIDFLEDGWIETVVNETFTYRAIGLSSSNTDAGLNTIDHAFYLQPNNLLQVRVNGATKTSYGPYQTGDVLRIERTNGVVQYKINGNLIYTSTVLSVTPLLVDFTINQCGATLKQVSISPSFKDPSTVTPLPNQQTITWTDELGTIYQGDEITKTSGPGWNAGAASVEQLDYLNDGWIESTIKETHTYRGFGLSSNNADAQLNSIEYGFYIQINGNLNVRESGANKASFSYQSGDVLRIERILGTIYYSINGNVIYTNTDRSIEPLVADFSIHDKGATLKGMTLSPSFVDPATITPQPSAQTISWTNILGISFVGNEIVKTAGNGWSSGAASEETLDALEDGWIETTIKETHSYRAFGLSEIDEDQALNSIDYSFYLHTGGQLEVRENGTKRIQHSSYQPDDILRIERVSGQVRYKLNGNTLYTSTIASTTPLIADLSMYDMASTLKAVTLSPSFVIPSGTTLPVEQTINWTDPIGIDFVGDAIVKTNDVGWTAGAASIDKLSAGADGWLESVINETHTARTFGLSDSNPDAGLNSIDYGFMLNNNGSLTIRENTSNRLTYGPYQTGDVLRIQRVGGNISYSINGTVIYNSTIASSGELIADLSLYTPGTTLKQLRLSVLAAPPGSTGNGGQWSREGNLVFVQDAVAIGTDTPHTDHLLSVKGTIVAQGVKVTLQEWADYVFEQGYELTSLKELRAFIERYKHLPGIPNEKEVIANGIDLEDMAVLQMQKIEELTLYLLDQDKRMNQQEQLIKELRNELMKSNEKKSSIKKD